MRSFAIVPAAGRSERMGQPKLLLPWGRATLIEHVLAQWRASRVDEIVVIVSPENTPLAELCRTLDCRLVIPEAPPSEMLASIQCGLKLIEQHFRPDPLDVWLVAPADLPSLAPATINAVLTAYHPHDASIVVPRHGARGGHPAMFSWSLAAAALQLADGQTLKHLFDQFPIRQIELPSDALAEDLDTPQDYTRLHNRQIR